MLSAYEFILRGEPTDWDMFTRTFLLNLSKVFDENNYAVGHVKVIAENGKRFIAGNITGNGETLLLRGSAGTDEQIKLIINARVETTPENLDAIVRETLQQSVSDKYDVEVIAWKYLQPGRPQPTHRFTEVVSSNLQP